MRHSRELSSSDGAVDSGQTTKHIALLARGVSAAQEEFQIPVCAAPSPQYKRPRGGLRSLSSSCPDKTPKARAALFLDSRCEKDEESDKTSSGGSTEDASRSHSAAEDPAQDEGLDEEGGLASEGTSHVDIEPSTACAPSGKSLAGIAQDLSLSPDEGQTISEQSNPPGVEKGLTPMGVGSLPLPVHQEMNSLSPPSSQEAWRKDPVFLGMEYVGCSQQYTEACFQRFLERRREKEAVASAVRSHVDPSPLALYADLGVAAGSE